MPLLLHAFAKSFARPACCKNVHVQAIIPSPHDVFISHRGPDTRRNIAGLLYDNLLRLGLKPFLDYRNMKPGDKLYEKIDTAIRDCKVGVVVLSPRYCESLYCLHELALLMECQKRVIPIFYNVKPSQLRVGNKIDGTYFPEEKLERFRRALEEAKDTLDFALIRREDIGQSSYKVLVMTSRSRLLRVPETLSSRENDRNWKIRTYVRSRNVMRLTSSNTMLIKDKDDHLVRIKLKLFTPQSSSSSRLSTCV